MSLFPSQFRALSELNMSTGAPCALLLVALVASGQCTRVHVAYSDEVVQRIDRRHFLSYTLESDLLRYPHFRGINWLYALKLARPLAPARIRVGGTCSDLLTFSPRANCAGGGANRWADGRRHRWPPIVPLHGDDRTRIEPFHMTGGQFDRLNWLARSAGSPLLLFFPFFFDLNMALGARRWDESNARLLLDYADAMHYRMDFELGNEPDHWDHWLNKTISGRQLADNYARLRRLLASYRRYAHSKLVGPAMSATVPLMIDFLKAGGGQLVDAVTFHRYYGDGRLVALPFFTDPHVMDEFGDELRRINATIYEHIKGRNKPELWLGETATAWNGGKAGVSDAYVAGFLWMDTLGLCAREGVKAVFRQTFYSNNYALTDPSTRPNPDYWLSVLYKRLVPGNVHSVTVEAGGGNATKYFRFYAHSDDRGRVVIYGMNLSNHTASVSFGARSSPVEQFLLTPADRQVLCRHVRLNGALLAFDGTSIGPLDGTVAPQPVALPPMTFGFWIIN